MRKARSKDEEQAIAAFERTRKSRSVPLKEKKTTHYGNTLRQYREKAGMDQRYVGEAIGYSTNTISNWENGVSRPDIDAVPKLCQLLHIPLPVFFDIESDPSVPDDENQLLNEFRTLNEEHRQTVVQLARRLVKSETHVRKTVKKLMDCILLPLQPVSAAAGTGMPADDISSKPDRVFVTDNRLARQADAVYLVNGDSMEPKYNNGDHVYVEYVNELKYGDVGIFIVSGAQYIKEYRKSGLYSYNRNYRIMKLSDDDDVRLIGRVLGRVEADELMDSVLKEL